MKYVILHLSKLVIWGSTWGRGFRSRCFCPLDGADRQRGGVARIGADRLPPIITNDKIVARNHGGKIKALLKRSFLLAKPLILGVGASNVFSKLSLESAAGEAMVLDAMQACTPGATNYEELQAILQRLYSYVVCIKVCSTIGYVMLYYIVLKHTNYI